jgi:hypothetical protein
MHARILIYIVPWYLIRFDWSFLHTNEYSMKIFTFFCLEKFLYRSMFLLFSSYFFFLIYHHHCYFAFLYKAGSKKAVCLSSLCACAKARLHVKLGRPTRWFQQERWLVLTVRRLFFLCGKCDVFSFFSLSIATTAMKEKYFFAFVSLTIFFSLHRHTMHWIYQNKNALDHNIFVLTK